MLNRLSSQRNRKSLKVLLLEKKSSLLFDIIRNFLTHAGFKEIYHSEDISGAKQLLKSHNIDLVIADTDEHHTTGVDLLKLVRLDPHLSHIPFVIISGQANLESVHEVLHLGNAEYLIKPFSELLFHEKIDLALGHGTTDEAKDKVTFPLAQALPCKVLICSTLQIAISSDEVLPEMLLSSDISSVADVVMREKDIDIVILDEQIAKAASEDTRSLLALRAKGQIELILLLDDISESHLQNLHRLGLLYLLEKRHSELYLNQLIPLLVFRRRALLKGEAAVDELRDNLATKPT